MASRYGIENLAQARRAEHGAVPCAPSRDIVYSGYEFSKPAEHRLQAYVPMGVCSGSFAALKAMNLDTMIVWENV
jgi:hypothetical protein